MPLSMLLTLAQTPAPLTNYLLNVLIVGCLVGIPVFLLGVWIGRIVFNKKREACNDCAKRREELLSRKATLEEECRALEAKITVR